MFYLEIVSASQNLEMTFLTIFLCVPLPPRKLKEGEIDFLLLVEYGLEPHLTW